MGWELFTYRTHKVGKFYLVILLLSVMLICEFYVIVVIISSYGNLSVLAHQLLYFLQQEVIGLAPSSK